MAQTSTSNSLPKYRLLGNSSLRVFPLCLGTMQFGQKESPFTKNWGLGTSFEEAESILLRYIEVGGNFLDTANFYHLGESEEWIGKIITKNKVDREKLVIATKYSLPMVSGDPNATGNHKKNLRRSIRDSLKRLQTDYVDILYVHFWDWSVNIENLMRDLDEVVKSGQVLHIAASDLPSWVVASANTLAQQKGWTPFTAYQGRYNLTERDLEQEMWPMAKNFNIATVPWSVLGAGKLTGTRTRENQNAAESTRANVKMTENDFKIQDVLIEIAKELNRTPGQVALNWALHKTTTPLLGCRTRKQLDDNLGALEFDLTPEQIAKLDEVSKESPALIFPHNWNGSSTANCPWLYVPEKKYSIQL